MKFNTRLYKNNYKPDLKKMETFIETLYAHMNRHKYIILSHKLWSLRKW